MVCGHHNRTRLCNHVGEMIQGNVAERDESKIPPNKYRYHIYDSLVLQELRTEQVQKLVSLSDSVVSYAMEYSPMGAAVQILFHKERRVDPSITVAGFLQNSLTFHLSPLPDSYRICFQLRRSLWMWRVSLFPLLLKLRRSCFSQSCVVDYLMYAKLCSRKKCPRLRIW